MSKHLKFHVDDYGTIKIKLPNVYTRESVEKVIGETVLATLNLAVEGPRRPKFHPVLGLASDEKSDTP